MFAPTELQLLVVGCALFLIRQDNARQRHEGDVGTAGGTPMILLTHARGPVTCLRDTGGIATQLSEIAINSHEHVACAINKARNLMRGVLLMLWDALSSIWDYESVLP
ncbi:hypothetical protein B0H10DRAFT_1956502 [Mycena sp. CBHHK59/15]|nr:hypothetical protein B0H10DRAFT_1956502 [Mycena sp. CBHHK59/15]